jgi:hypothetical protein
LARSIKKRFFENHLYHSNGVFCICYAVTKPEERSSAEKAILSEARSQVESGAVKLLMTGTRDPQKSETFLMTWNLCVQIFKDVLEKRYPQYLLEYNQIQSNGSFGPKIRKVVWFENPMDNQDTTKLTFKADYPVHIISQDNEKEISFGINFNPLLMKNDKPIPFDLPDIPIQEIERKLRPSELFFTTNYMM